MRKTALALLLAAALPAAAQPSPRPDAPASPPPAQGAAPAAPAPASAAPGTSAPAAAAAAAPAREPAPRGTVLEEVSGKVAGIDRKAHKLTVETAGGPVTLSLDRNTMVYTATGLGTVLDVTPGLQIRAGRNAEFLAYWVQVRAVANPATSTPGQGTGPAGGGAAPASEGAGPGTGGAPSPPATGAGPGPGGPVGGGTGR